MKLSDLDPKDITIDQPQKKSGLKLSDIHPDDIQQEQHAPEDTDLLSMRSAKDLGIGALQGVTLGAAPILEGAVQATGDVMFGDTNASDWVKQYRQHQQEQQAAVNAARERSPVLVGAGEVAGGLAMPMGAIGLAGKGLGLGGKALLAGGIGAAQGAMTSEGTLGSAQMAKDALTSGALGTVGGAVMEGAAPLIGKGLNKLSSATGLDKAIENYPSIKQSIIPFTETKAGRPFLGKAGETLRDAQLKEAGTELDAPLNNLRNVVKEKYDNVLSNATGLNVTPELSNDLQKAKKLINANKINYGMSEGDLPSARFVYDESGNIVQGKVPTSEQMAVEQRIDKALESGKVDAQDLKEIQKWSRDQQGVLNGGATDEYLESLNNSSKKILGGKTNGIENVPGYTDVNNQFGDIEDTLSSFSKKTPIEQLDVGGKKATGNQLYKTSEDVIAKSQLPYDVGKKQSRQLRELGENLQGLSLKDPTLLEDIGIKDIPSFLKNAEDASNIQAVSKSMRGAGQMGQTGLLSKLGGGSRAGIQYTGAAAGSVINKASSIGGKLAAMPSQALSGLAQKLSSSPATSHMGEALNNAIQASAQNPGSVSKNAALFTILQNPSSRKVAQEMFGDMFGDEKEGNQK